MFKIRTSITVEKCSESARKKVEGAGGKVIVMEAADESVDAEAG